MPLYEYECNTCHRRLEKIQKFSDAPLTVCPHCGGELERLINAPAISFKGGGWYADGYGNAKPKSSGDGSKSSTPASKPASDSNGAGSATVSTPAASAPASTTASDKK